MVIRDLKGKVHDRIPIKTVLLSVSDKSGLEVLVPELIRMQPDVKLLSTGGTYRHIERILEETMGENQYVDDNLMQVATYTEFPEMDGGLVKTLHPKIYAGLLGERENYKHQAYLSLELNGASFIDLVVVNLYPFGKTVAKDDCTFEKARGNIDIGGPAMLRAGAKNLMSCAVLTNPMLYEGFLRQAEENDGSTTFGQRLDLMPGVFRYTAEYDSTIEKYMTEQVARNAEAVRAEYDFVGDSE